MRFAYFKVLRLISRAGEVSFKRISYSLNFFGGRRPLNQEPSIQAVSLQFEKQVSQIFEIPESIPGSGEPPMNRIRRSSFLPLGFLLSI